jgi:hypothetical protein
MEMNTKLCRWAFGSEAAVLLSALLAGCGGGGGAGASSSAAGTTSPAQAGSSSGGTVSAPGGDSSVLDTLSVHLRSPAAVQDVSFGDSSPTGVELQIGYSGEAGALTGRTLYMRVEGPEPLYESRPVSYLGLNEPIIHVLLGGNLQGVPEGRYTGTLSVHVCLDLACSTQVRNSPLSIPYDVEMKPGLKLSHESLDLETAFGTALPASEVAVMLPSGGTDWSAFSTDPLNIAATRSGDKLLLTPSPFARPGTYATDVIVESSAPDPKFPNTIWRFYKALKVTYTVKTSAAPYVMSPVSASYFLWLNDPSQHNARIGFSLQDPQATLSPRGIRFDANPSAAAGHPQANRWLHASVDTVAEYFVAPCGTVPGAPNCLPAGAYQAALLYRVSGAAGVTADLEFPVTMIIAP